MSRSEDEEKYNTPRFAYESMRPKRGAYLKQVILSGCGLFLVVLIHSLVEYGTPFELRRGATLLMYCLGIAAVLWAIAYLIKPPKSAPDEDDS